MTRSIIDSRFLNLALLKPDDVQDDKQGLVGADHVAYTYAAVDDLLKNYEQLKAWDIKRRWCVRHGVSLPRLAEAR